jgi:uncharacterized coiled-coil protein SlyX
MKPLTVIKRLASGADEVASIEAEIARLKAEGAAATREAERLAAAKLDAADFEAVEQLDREIAKQRWIADRAAHQLPELAARLANAQAERQRAAIARHLAERRRLYRKLRKAVEDATAVQVECIRADEQACAELGEHVARQHLPAIAFRGMLVPDLVALWTNENDRIFAAPAPPAAPVPHLAESPRSAPQKQKPAAPAAPQLPPPRPHPRRDPPPDDGQRQVVFIRFGVDLPDGSAAHVGDRVTLLADQARKLVEAGAADFVTENGLGA